VAQLKRSEREKNVMKIQYEEKLAQQQQKIRETEHERDQVLASLGITKTHFSLLTVAYHYHGCSYYSSSSFLLRRMATQYTVHADKNILRAA